jgi:hypothetical protein
MSARLLTLAVALMLAGACHSSSRPQSPTQADGAWYDARPLLVSLAPELRADAASLAGLKKAEDLPLYDLDLDVDLSAQTFKLGEELWFTNREAAPEAEVVLRLFANEARKKGSAEPPLVRFVSGSCPDDSRCIIGAEGPSTIAVHPSVPLSPGGHLRVSLQLDGKLETIDASRTNLFAQGLEGMSSFGGGEGGGDYGLLAIGDDIASFGSFFPVIARKSGGAWVRVDKSTMGDLGSDDLSNVRASVTLPAGAKLATSGVVTSEEALVPAGGAGAAAEPRKRFHVAAAFVRDFSMLASLATDVATRDVNGVTVRSYFRPGERGAGEQALDVAAHAIADFERRFGAYPYVDFDVSEAAIVGGAGGVEFSGLATAASMFYKPPDAGGGPMAMLSKLGAGGGAGPDLGGMMDSMLEFVVAHEVAHQWWHGVVGSDSREHPFVDEGLAQYSAGLYLQDRYGNERATRDGDMNVKMNYQMMRMMGTPDGAVDRPVEAFPSALAYAGLVYGKGPYFYSALRKAIGDEAFFAAFAEYVRRYRLRIAPENGLLDIAAAGANGPRVRALARHWLEEAHGDDDLGQLDLASALSSMLGGLLPGAADAGAPKGPRGKGPKGAGAQPDANELLRQLLQQMQEGQ